MNSLGDLQNFFPFFFFFFFFGGSTQGWTEDSQLNFSFTLINITRLVYSTYIYVYMYISL